MPWLVELSPLLLLSVFPVLLLLLLAVVLVLAKLLLSAELRVLVQDSSKRCLTSSAL
jgi:hypothetical protein